MKIVEDVGKHSRHSRTVHHPEDPFEDVQVSHYLWCETSMRSNWERTFFEVVQDIIVSLFQLGKCVIMLIKSTQFPDVMTLFEEAFQDGVCVLKIGEP